MKEKCNNCPLLKYKDVPCWSVEEQNGIPCGKLDTKSKQYNPKYPKFIMEKSGVKTKLPPLLEEIGNLAEATADIMKDGFIKATQAEQKRRMEICQKCEMYEQGRCKSCGCFVEKKVVWRISSCPIGQWNEENQQILEAEDINPSTIYDCGCNK